MEFIQENILLVILAFSSGIMLITGFGATGPSVSANQATKLINSEDALVIDVRGGAEYNAGHLIGARNIPLAKLGEHQAELGKSKEKPFIVCCESGITSARAVRSLKKAGFRRAVNLDGGIAAWRKAGLPLTSKKGERK